MEHTSLRALCDGAEEVGTWWLPRKRRSLAQWGLQGFAALPANASHVTVEVVLEAI